MSGEARGSSRTDALKRWFGRSRALWVAALAAVVLSAPSLGAGLQTEDYAHRVRSQSADGLVNLFELEGDPIVRNRGALAEGTLPWIARGDLSIRLLRPVASLTHHLDYRAWPDFPWLMHVQSLAWLVAAVLAVGLLYRRMMAPAWIAGLATLLYALDEGHGPAIGWLANRSALLATAFGAGSILAHDRWRRDGSTVGAIVAPLALGVALLSSEAAIGVIAYLVAHAVFIEDRPWTRRCAALAPAFGVTLIWGVTYRVLGYGAIGSGVYLDPLSQPVELVQAAAVRLPILLAGQLGPLPVDLYAFVRPLRPTVVAAVCWAVVVAAAFVLIPLVRRDRVARFWAGGALLSVVPACTTIPSDRLMFVPGIGAMALVASLIGQVVESPSPARGGAVVRGVAWVWAVGFLVISPAALPFRSLGLRSLDDRLVRAASDLTTVARPDQHLALINVPDFYTGSILVATRHAPIQHLKPTSSMLYGGWEPVVVERVDDHTLRIRSDGFMRHGLNRVFRSARDVFAPGDSVDTGTLSAVVREVDADGQPRVVDFRFAGALIGGDRLRLAAFDGERFVPFEALPAGEAKTIAPTVPKLPASY